MLCEFIYVPALMCLKGLLIHISELVLWEVHSIYFDHIISPPPLLSTQLCIFLFLNYQVQVVLPMYLWCVTFHWSRIDLPGATLLTKRDSFDNGVSVRGGTLCPGFLCLDLVHTVTATVSPLCMCPAVWKTVSLGSPTASSSYNHSVFSSMMLPESSGEGL